MSRLIYLALTLFVALATPAAAQTSSGDTDNAAADDIAAQIREQGYGCDDPASARRDQDAAEADDATWILTCKNASYRVRLIPDMAAEVEQID